MERKIKKLPVDKETHKLLNYDSLYYVPNNSNDECEPLKGILKLKKGSE